MENNLDNTIIISEGIRSLSAVSDISRRIGDLGPDIKIVFKRSLLNGGIAFCTTLIGCAGGPVGAVAGATVGCAVASVLNKRGKYLTLTDCYNRMTANEKEEFKKLVVEVRDIASRLLVSAFPELAGPMIILKAAARIYYRGVAEITGGQLNTEMELIARNVVQVYCRQKNILQKI